MSGRVVCHGNTFPWECIWLLLSWCQCWHLSLLTLTIQYCYRAHLRASFQCRQSNHHFVPAYWPSVILVKPRLLKDITHPSQSRFTRLPCDKRYRSVCCLTVLKNEGDWCSLGGNTESQTAVLAYSISVSRSRGIYLSLLPRFTWGNECLLLLYDGPSLLMFNSQVLPCTHTICYLNEYRSSRVPFSPDHMQSFHTSGQTHCINHTATQKRNQHPSLHNRHQPAQIRVTLWSGNSLSNRME